MIPILTLTDLTIRGGVTWLNSWFPLSVMALTLSLVIHVAFLMIAKAFSVKEFQNYATAEILQALATAVMVGSLILMLNSALDLSRTFIHGDLYCGGEGMHIGSDSDSVMDEAFDAIRCRLQEKASSVAEIQGRLINDAGTWSKFNIMNMQLSLFGITFLKGDWLSDIYEETETIRVTNNLATVLLIGLNAQSAVVAYLKANALTMFIPLGILLRSFYFSRGAGALFLAFGIGMYFIFPILYILTDPGFVPSPPPPDDAANPATQQYCYATMSTTVSLLQGLQDEGSGTTSPIGEGSIRDELSKSYIELMLHPLVAFFMTMIFIRYMMTVLGSDSYELVRMVSKVV